MTVFEKIIEAIEPFGFPYTPGVYKGEEKHWFTLNYVDDRGNLYADDEPQSVLATVQVHFFMPYNEDFVRIKNKIRDAIFRQGFTFPEIEILSDTDPQIRHLVFECEIEEEE
ncbi:phage tail protein [Faecalimonas umbilicata]|uniref:phage tail protein n=1 Tax=Faecalimonas umbilicata TaxID=1912855 RepID=UPI002A7FF7F6|nr:phage tail protein [Faecalimonas umbilicata]MDY4596863.1 phage tail protein [Faecalimonas umbilicata]